MYTHTEGAQPSKQEPVYANKAHLEKQLNILKYISLYSKYEQNIRLLFNLYIGIDICFTALLASVLGTDHATHAKIINSTIITISILGVYAFTDIYEPLYMQCLDNMIAHIYLFDCL